VTTVEWNSKEYRVSLLHAKGLDVSDFGTHGLGSVDCLDFVREVSLRIAKGEAERGILICQPQPQSTQSQCPKLVGKGKHKDVLFGAS
jgi:hypothetical protein